MSRAVDMNVQILLIMMPSGAGADSTASTMQSFFDFVLNDDRVYTKLLAEIDNARRSKPESELFAYSTAQSLPYFQACLKEAMRLRPAVGLNIQRWVPEGGAEIDGKFYPGRTRVSVNGWVVHRNRATFGEEAEEFRPERWLAGNAKEMERHMYQVSAYLGQSGIHGIHVGLTEATQFGGGSHLCIGRNLALLEINKILPQLLLRYRFELVHPGRPLTHHTTFFVVQKGLEVIVHRR